jgi:hypothetical protein
MNISFSLSLGALASMAIVYGCKSSEPTPTASGNGGESGDTSAPAGKGGASSGGAAAGKGGKGGSGGSNAAGNGGSSGSAGGETSAAGDAGESGAGTSSGSGTGGGGNATGQAGASNAAVPEDRGYVLGPEDDDQGPIVVGVEHSGFAVTRGVLLTDADDNVFTCDNTKIYQYGADLEPGWSAALTFTGVSAPPETALAVASDGGVFFGSAASTNAALPGETSGGAGDAVIGKINAAGTLEWAHQLGGAGNEATVLTAATSDGAVIAMGTCSAQLPGMPSSVSGGPWLARYEADGTRAFLKQYEPGEAGSAGFGKLFILKNGNILMVGSSTTFLADADGNELSRNGSGVPGKQVPGGALTPVALDADSSALFSWTYDGVLTQRDLDGTPRWFRKVEPPRMAEIDPVEGVIWTGKLSGADTSGTHPSTVTVAKDAIYLTGTYTNSYKNGSTARPTTMLVFMGRYDLDGNRVWFQELTFDVTTGATPMAVALDSDDNPIVALSGNNAATQGFVIKLDKSDGSLL